MVLGDRTRPLPALALAAAHGERLRLGTAIAVAHGRSPYANAQVAWDSNGCRKVPSVSGWRGVLTHSLHTEPYLRDVVFPAADGRSIAGRTDSFAARSLVFGGIVHDDEQARMVRDEFRRQIAFYGSTKAFLPSDAGAEDIEPPP